MNIKKDEDIDFNDMTLDISSFGTSIRPWSQS